MNKIKFACIIILCLVFFTCQKEPSYDTGDKKLDTILNNLVKGEKTIQALNQITNLDLSNLQLTQLPEIIKNCTSLSKINLSNNKLESVDLTSFAKLTHINLANNKLQTFSNKWLNDDTVKNIQSLDLTGNQIQTIPNDIKSMKNLSSLYLGSNELTKVDNSLNSLRFLRILNVSNNKISSIDLSNRAIQVLNIENNNLREIPEEILTNKLMILNAGNNNFRKIPDEIINCSSLHTLRLEGNKIWYYPPQMEKLTNLKVLNLSNCNLTYIPTQICVISSLETLYLNYNSLSTVPNAFAGLTSLRQVYLDDNKYTTFYYGLSLVGKTLKLLSLKNNQIKELPDYVTNAFNLDYFDMSGNPITEEQLNKIKISDNANEIFIK